MYVRINWKINKPNIVGLYTIWITNIIGTFAEDVV